MSPFSCPVSLSPCQSYASGLVGRMAERLLPIGTGEKPVIRLKSENRPPPILYQSWEADNGVGRFALLRPTTVRWRGATEGELPDAAPVVMEYIAEHKREELARDRGQRNWKSLFRRA